MKKYGIIAFTVVFLLLACLHVGAQEGQGIIDIENGVVFGYNLNTDTVGIGHGLGFNLTLSDVLKVGFRNINGDGTNVHSFNLFMFDYRVFNGLGVLITAGSDNTLAGTPPVTGMSVYYNAIERVIQGRLSTRLKIEFGYLNAVTQTLDNGLVSGTISASLGF